MTHKRTNREHWPVTVAHSPDIVAIEFSGSLQDDVLHPVICKLYEKLPRMAMSQYIDPRIESGAGKVVDLANALTTKHGLEMYSTVDYADPRPPESPKEAFIMHTFGTASMDWVGVLARFNASSLGHISYGLSAESTVSLDEVLEWNSVLVKWFQLRQTLTSKPLLKVIRAQQPVSVLIDGSLVFLLASLPWLDDVLCLLESTADARGAELAWKFENMLVTGSRWHGRGDSRR